MSNITTEMNEVSESLFRLEQAVQSLRLRAEPFCRDESPDGKEDSVGPEDPARSPLSVYLSTINYRIRDVERTIADVCSRIDFDPGDSREDTGPASCSRTTRAG